MTFRTLDDAADLSGRTALVRVDFNGPMEGGKVTDDTRLKAALPTIHRLREAGAKVVLLAHFDRPKGERVASMSLRPVVEPLELLLHGPVRFADDCVGDEAKAAVAEGRPVDLALKEARVWGARQPLFKRAMQRIGVDQARAALRLAARIDRMVKGIGTGDVWDEFLRLGLLLSGHSVSCREE